MPAKAKPKQKEPTLKKISSSRTEQKTRKAARKGKKPV
jgi:hypothetical protein